MRSRRWGRKKGFKVLVGVLVAVIVVLGRLLLSNFLPEAGGTDAPETRKPETKPRLGRHSGTSALGQANGDSDRHRQSGIMREPRKTQL